MKFEVIVKTDQGMVSTITENALEANSILNKYRFRDDIQENVYAIIKNRDSGEFYATYDYFMDDDGITERDWTSNIWLETVAELLVYGGYSTEEVM